MRRFFLIFLALWLILPAFGWRSFSAFGWAEDGGGTISECVDTLTWVDEWWAYTNTYKGFSQTDTSVIVSRGLTANGHHHFFKLDRLFENADSIYIDSIKLKCHPPSFTDADTYLFSLDTLIEDLAHNHEFWSVSKIIITGTNPSFVLHPAVKIRTASKCLLRIWRKTATTNMYEQRIYVFFKKYR